MFKLSLDRYIQIAMGVMAVLLILAIYAPLHETIVQVGDRAPDFSIKADNGRTYTKSDFGGKLLILNFWATWCAAQITWALACRRESRTGWAS